MKNISIVSLLLILISCSSEIDVTSKGDNVSVESSIRTVKPINNSNRSKYPVNGICTPNGSVVSVIASNGRKKDSECQGNKFDVEFDFADIAEGEILTFESSIGNQVSEPTPPVEKDTIAPNLTSPASYTQAEVTSSNLNNFDVSGSCDEDGAEVGLSIGTIEQTTICSGGTYSFTGLDLSSEPEGTLSVSVYIEDGAGNRTDVPQTSLTKDTQGPVITHNLTSANAANSGAYVFGGNCEGSEDVRLQLAGYDFLAGCSSGTYTSGNVNLTVSSDGNISVTITQADSLGNTTVVNETIVKDVAAPNLLFTAINSQAVGGVTFDIDPTYPLLALPISGTCDENGATITAQLDGVDVSSPLGLTCDGSNFSGTLDFLSSNVSLASGQYSGELILRMSDSVGNTISTTGVTISTEDEFNALSTLQLADDKLGAYIVTSNNIMAVSAPNKNTGLAGSGTVYTYQKVNGGWNYIGEITKPGGAQNNAFFGSSLAVEGNTLVVGCIFCDNGDPDEEGAAYVYTFDGTNWDSGVALVPSFSLSGFNRYGRNVAISGGKVAVSAPGADSQGRVFVFNYDGSNWIEEAELEAPGTQPNSIDFGDSISFSGTTIAVGARMARYSSQNRGGVYIFTFDGTNWNRVQDIEGGSVAGWKAADFLGFGAAVTISGTRLVIGSEGDGQGFDDSGAIHSYTFNGTTFDYEDSYAPSNATHSRAIFGSSLSYDGQYLTVGSWRFEGAAGGDTGELRILEHDGSDWVVRHVIEGSNDFELGFDRYDGARGWVDGGYIYYPQIGSGNRILVKEKIIKN